MKKFLICFLIILIVLLPTNKALAEEQIDFNKNGSIDITFRDTDGNIVKGGAVTVRKVADLCYDNQEYSYVYTEQFVASGYSLDKSGIPELAMELHEYAIDNQIDGIVYNNTEGKIKIENLTVGLYLISQETAADGYSKIVPFLVSMPCQSYGKLVYEVDASPKMSPVNQETIAPEPTTKAEDENETPGIKPEEIETPEIKTEEIETTEIIPEETEITEIKPERTETPEEIKTKEDKPERTNTGDTTFIMVFICIFLMCISILVVGINFRLKNTSKHRE